MYNKFLLILFLALLACEEGPHKNRAYVPSSNGRINTVSVVMPKSDWNGALGKSVRDQIGAIYEGLPETTTASQAASQRFTLRYDAVFPKLI